MPPGDGRVWFDVGCGPGLVARLAAENGYRTTGFDIDPAMISQARRLAQQEASSARFVVAGLDEVEESNSRVDVVSAASLLAVLDDRADAMRKLLSCLNDDGVLLVIETTDAMRPGAAWDWLKRASFGGRNWILLLWAWTRRNRASVSLSDLAVPGYRVVRTELLGGLVAAWAIRRANTNS